MADELVMSQRELARVFGVSQRTIQRWEDEGLSQTRVGDAATYDLRKAVAWRIDEERRRIIAAQEETPSLDEARARKEMALAELRRLDLAERRAELIPVEVFEDVTGRVQDALRTAILNAVGRWAGPLTGLESPREAEGVLRQLTRELLEHLSGPVADSIEADDAA